MLLRLLPFALMAPWTLWMLWQLYQLRSQFWYAAAIVAMAMTAVFGFLMMFSGVVI